MKIITRKIKKGFEHNELIAENLTQEQSRIKLQELNNFKLNCGAGGFNFPYYAIVNDDEKIK